MWTTVLIGLGRIGMGYDLEGDDDLVLTHARAFSRHAGFRLVAGVDPDPARRETFEDRYAAPAYADAAEALALLRADVVVVAAPTHLHRTLILEALTHGPPRVILCEKPLGRDPDEAREILDACGERATELFVNYMRRSDPAVIQIRERIREGRIARPLKAVVWYSKGLRHNGSHFVNLLEYWLGPHETSRLLAAGRRWDGIDPEPDVRMQLELGSAYFLAAREEAFSHYTVEIVADNGRLRYDDAGETVRWQEAVADRRYRGYTVLDPHGEGLETAVRRSQAAVTEELARALRSEPYHLCTGREALATLQTVQEILAQVEA